MRGIAANPNVAMAVEVVDRFCIRSALYMGVNPLARLFAIVYLVVLHMWAFVVLSFHTHQMELGGPPAMTGLGAAAAAAATDSPAIISPTGQRLG